MHLPTCVATPVMNKSSASVKTTLNTLKRQSSSFTNFLTNYTVSCSLLVIPKRMQYIDFGPFLPLVATRTQSILVSCIKKKEKETTMIYKGVQHLLSRLLWLHGDGLPCATLSPIICRAQWLKHKTHLGEGGPRHRLAVLSSWFVSQQRSVSGPRLKVASRCGESRGLWQAAPPRRRGAPERRIREPFGIWNGLQRHSMKKKK